MWEAHGTRMFEMYPCMWPKTHIINNSKKELRRIHLTFRNTTDASNHDPDKSVGGGDYESYY